MAILDLDPQFVQALRLLHSTNKDSIEQLRNLLDEAIKQKYGASKMLSNTLHKRYAIEEIVLCDDSSTISKRSKSSNSSRHLRHSSKNSSPITIREPTPDPLQTDDNLADILEDVTCVICKGMDVGARNRLVECVKCGSLYHQECHSPPILDSQIDTNPVEWYCYNCTKSQPQPVILASKERSSPKTVIETKCKESKKSSSSKHSDRHSERHKSSNSSNQNSNGTSSSSKSGPSIHISSADKRLKDMAKKSKHDKRGKSSSSGSSKHSSSNSRSSHDKSYKNKSD